VSEQTFRGAVKTFRHEPQSGMMPLDVLLDKRHNISVVLAEEIAVHRSIKWYLCTHVCLSRSTANGIENAILPLRSSAATLFQMSDIDESVIQAIEKIKSTLDEIALKGSGWRVINTATIDIHIVKHEPLVGSSFIATPKDLQHKYERTIINVRNTDDKCFIYSFLAALHSQEVNRKSRCDPSSYSRFQTAYDFSTIPEPTSITAHQLEKFEQINNVSVNIYGHEDSKVFPVHISACLRPRHVDLLLISKGTTNHFIAIKSLEGLLFEQSKSNHRPVCRICLHQFHTKTAVMEHQKECGKHRPQRVTFPKPGTKLQFNSEYKKQRVGSIVYCDLESILVPGEDPSGEILQRHQVCSAAGIMICDDGTKKRFLQRAAPEPDRDIAADDEDSDAADLEADDVLPNFFRFLFDCAEAAYHRSRKVLNMTAKDERKFQKSTRCWMCKKEFSPRDVKTRDHDHVSEFFINCCYIRYRKPFVKFFFFLSVFVCINFFHMPVINVLSCIFTF
jgi:hypothetical protein